MGFVLALSTLVEFESVHAPLVVGYKGEIGRFILAGLLEDLPKANDIFCVDVNNTAEDVAERIERSDYVFLCVPLQHTEAWLHAHRGRLTGKIIVEQCSVKSFLYENKELANLRFISMHLLFRPSATPVSDRRCLIFGEGIEASVLDSFCENMCRALKTPIFRVEGTGEPAYVSHDRIMARHQSLTHRVLSVLAEQLSDINHCTFIGQRVLELAERIKAGDPILYQMIQENPYAKEAVEEFEQRLRCFPGPA